MSDFLETKYNRNLPIQCSEVNDILDRAEVIQKGELLREKTRNLAACDAGARDFWERCVLAAQASPQEAIEAADYLLAHWRKRFDPREKA